MRLTTFELAGKNIRRKPRRSFCLVLVILLFSFSLYAGSVLSLSLSGGVSSMSDRLGADIMVVPEGYDPHIDSILLSGKPSTFYLPRDVMELLREADGEGEIGIDRMSPQTFLATLNASCCSYPVQLVGIDYGTDFLIKPWLERTLHRDLKDGEVILGHHVAGDEGDELTFFKKGFPVAGRLEQTGMGFDATVFMTRGTLTALAREAERILKHPLTRDGSLISTVMIKLAPGYDSVKAARALNGKLNGRGIYALFSKKFVNTISSGLNLVSGLIKGFILLVWILAVVVIALVFAMTLGERRREMGVLRVLGATRGKLIRLALAEVFLICLYGSVLGTFLGGAAIAVFGPMATETLSLPFLLPRPTVLLLMGAASIVASVLTGLLTAARSAVRASRADIYDTMRDL
nr:ABC transporter permease [uncultured Fretibacterium sp.]